MQPRIHVITLGVDDLDRALSFYRDGLGLESEGIIATEFVGDFQDPDGHLWEVLWNPALDLAPS
jgi:Glyoxalase/Bleomycin resistance protein/Dioxygenase superfamily